MDGAVITGLGVMCLRKLQAISFSFGAMEYLRFAR